MSPYFALTAALLLFFGLAVVGDFSTFPAFAISGTVAFLAYALSHVPERYRRFGAGHIQQMRDHRNGHFGRFYPEEVIPPMSGSGRPGRNEPCPCGSGRKHKHCHGRKGT